MKTKLLLVALFWTVLGWGQGVLSGPIFSEDFHAIPNGTPLTTGNTAFSKTRVGTSTSGSTYANQIIAKNLSSFTASSGIISAKGGSISTVDKTTLSPFTSGTFTFKFKTPSSLSGAVMFGGVGTGSSFGSNNIFTGAQLSSAFQVNGFNLQIRANGTWTTVQTVAVSTSYAITVVFNNTASSLEYGNSSIVGANKCHLWLNGTYIGEYTAATVNLAASAFRIYTTTSAFEVDDIAVYNSLPAAGNDTCPSSTTTITPTSGPVGTNVSITSTIDLTGATVAINGVSAVVKPISASQISVLVPNSATSGSLVVTVSDCTVSKAFTVIDNITTQCQGGNVASDLFISEVTDSNYGGLGYIEIYNGTGVTKNLSSYSLKVASNGSTSYSSPLTLSSVLLTSGSIYVVATGLDAFSCSVYGGNGSLGNESTPNLGINFNSNGNDHIALFNGATKIDSWGTFGDANWASSLSIGTNGVDFKRKNTATVPNTTYNNSDWVIIDFLGSGSANCANNDYSDVGIYNFATGTPPSVTFEPSYTSTCKGTSLTTEGSEGYNGTSPADTKELAYQWFVNVPPATGWTALTNNTIYSGTNEAKLIISNITTLINNQYYCQIREDSNTCYTATIAVQITPVGIITWNGTDWRDLNNIITTPTLDNLVIIDADFDTATDGNLNACSLVINPNKTLTISATNPPFIGEFVNVKSDLTVDGDLVIENNGSLVQIEDDGINTGEISVNRTAQASKYDYIYWSSPVEDFPIASVPNSHRYEWNPTFSNIANGTQGNWVDASGNMTKGKGYIVRASNGETTKEDLPVTFTGIPFNGEFTYDIFRGSTTGTDDCWNLVGNPYPSAIDADAFLDANQNIEGSVRIWTHGKAPDTSYGDPFYQDFVYNYDEEDYIIYNGTATSEPAIFNGKIASGQGFFIRMLEHGETDVDPPTSTEIAADSNITFKNAFRRATNGNIIDNSNFFRPSNANSDFEKSRIWLDLISSNKQITKTVVGYVPGATLAKDRLYDALIEVESFKLYSLIKTQKQAIQGRPLPFDTNDLVPMGMVIEKEGSYIIAIAAVDGLFLDLSQPIYLEDKLLNIIHDLKRTPYTFTAAAGEFNQRFVLRYNNSALSKTDFESANQVVITTNHSQLTITSKAEAISKIQIFDMLGRRIYDKKNVDSNIYSIADLVKNQVLIVKVKLQNGDEISNKVIVK